MESVSAKLRDKVNESGIKYTAISRKTGLSVDTISKIFLGKRRLMADELFKICEAAGIGVNELFCNNKTAS